MPTYNQAPGQVQTAMLGTPTPPPGQQNPNSYNPWETYDSTTPQATDDFAVKAGEGEGTGEVSTMDLNREASNVGGIVEETQDAKDWKTFVPEAKDPLEEEINEFETAYNEGHEESDFTHSSSDGGMQSARQQKREDRREDRDQRQDLRKEQQDESEAAYLADGMGKGKARRKARRDSRRTKRGIRKGQRANRKEAWDTFKGSKDLQQVEDAYEMEEQNIV